MNNEQKSRLAGVVMGQVGALFENWDERVEAGGLLSNVADIDPVEARLQISRWMTKLPGDQWDTRLVPFEDL